MADVPERVLEERLELIIALSAIAKGRRIGLSTGGRPMGSTEAQILACDVLSRLGIEW